MGDIMNRKRLEKLRGVLERLRRGADIPRKELEGLSSKAGRRRRSQQTGEQRWESERFPDLMPLSIPKSTPVKTYTARSVLDQLEEDLDRWDEILED